MTLHTQAMTMIAMIIGGVYLGFGTETFRRIEVKWQARTIARYMIESVYWIVQTCLLFYVLYRMNEGEIRFVFILACLLGYSMYIVLCKRWYVRFLETMLHIIKQVIKWIVTFIDTLFIQPIIWLTQLSFRFMKLIYKFLIKLLYLLIYPLLFLIKKYLPEKTSKKISKILTTCSTMKDNSIIYVKKWIKKWR